MPPKGKKGKGGKKKSKGKQEVERPTPKEAILQTELDKKVQELAELKLRAHQALEENNWLNEEAKKVRTEMNEYTQFMSKKTNRRQTQVVTLNDYHRQEIQEINSDKMNMLKDYEQKKQELQSQLIKKQKLLHDLIAELETMNEHKETQQKQDEEIRRLQNEISRVRCEHVNEISRMKETFEREIGRQRIESNTKVANAHRQANQAAEQYIYEQTVKIQNENVALRTKLHDILKRSQALKELKQRLEEEQMHLIRRIKLSNDLRKIRMDKLSSGILTDSTDTTPH